MVGALVLGYPNKRFSDDGSMFVVDADYLIVDTTTGAKDVGLAPCVLDPLNPGGWSAVINQAVVDHAANVITFPSPLPLSNIRKPQFGA